jgi:hypothetical protein
MAVPTSQQQQQQPQQPPALHAGLTTVPKSAQGDRGLPAAVHTSHSSGAQNSGRQRTYLIATYTSVLTAADVAEDWFVPDAHEPAQHVVAAQLRQKAPVKTSDRGTSPQTDASVGIELQGRDGRWTGAQLLAAHDPTGQRVMFRPGAVDEFAVTCADVGDIASLKVINMNDGHDWNSSRWKLGEEHQLCTHSIHGYGLI